MSRSGPGIAGALVPNFSAGAGDSDTNYSFKASQGLGVWTLSAEGRWEDAVGTSFAAPIVAREAARVFEALQPYCPPGVSPFASTVKAYLALVARQRSGPLPSRVQNLADHTLGRGQPSADRLLRPQAASAVFIWQGTLVDLTNPHE
jgi:hypothetical protein